MTTVGIPRSPSTLPPGPGRRFPGQNLAAFTRDRLGFFTRLAREHGDIARIRIGPQQLVLLSHPDHIRDVLITFNRNFVKGRGVERSKRLLGNGLLTSEGEFHLRQRRLAQPAFHRERISAYGDVMARYAARAADSWRDGQTLNIPTVSAQLTLAIAAKTLFDTNLEDEAREIGEALGTVIGLFNIALLPFSEVMDRLPLPWTLRFNRARARLDETIYRLIARRHESGEDHGDLLSMLMMARDTEQDGGRMSDEQLRDEAMTLLLAGHETTAVALAWSWYLLAQNPDVEATMLAEVDAVLGTRLPTAADVARLPYTRMVLAESMRLYPPAWALTYRALDDQPMGGYVIPRNSVVIMSQYLVHRDPRFYDDPERFDPERWTPEAQARRPRFAYFPFGGGPRQCIGEAFAWMEGVLVLATVAQRVRLERADGREVKPNPLFTLRPKGEMAMVVRTRGPR
ncbi:MAG: cytochrome P450 [Gemmatimonadota bacterium]|nr:cytochrome P450 [Gemmatimonadota bacterium]